MRQNVLQRDQAIWQDVPWGYAEALYRGGRSHTQVKRLAGREQQRLRIVVINPIQSSRNATRTSKRKKNNRNSEKIKFIDVIFFADNSEKGKKEAIFRLEG